MTQLNRIFLSAVWLFLLLGNAGVAAKTYTAGPGDYRHVLRVLSPGDILQLAPGYYRRGLPIHGLHGTDGAPIAIAGSSDGPPTVLLGRPGSNTVSIKNAAHVIVRDLELDGRGAFVDAVKAEGHADYAHHITLENLYIHDYAAQQQSVGISTKCPAWDWVVRGNRIGGVGTGMYFGNSNGEDPFVGGLIEDNDIFNTIGYNLQIKHQKARPKIDGMPQDTRLTIIRRNRFVKEKGGSIEINARPNVLVGHFPLKGPGSDDTYAIYGNLFLENPNEALFQGEGNIALYGNTFFNSHDIEFPAIAIQPHNDVPRRIDIFSNTVFHPDVGIRLIRPSDGRSAQLRFVANAIIARVPFLWFDAAAESSMPDAQRSGTPARGSVQPGLLQYTPWMEGDKGPVDLSVFKHLPEYDSTPRDLGTDTDGVLGDSSAVSNSRGNPASPHD